MLRRRWSRALRAAWPRKGHQRRNLIIGLRERARLQYPPRPFGNGARALLGRDRFIRIMKGGLGIRRTVYVSGENSLPRWIPGSCPVIPASFHVHVKDLPCGWAIKPIWGPGGRRWNRLALARSQRSPPNGLHRLGKPGRPHWPGPGNDKHSRPA